MAEENKTIDKKMLKEIQETAKRFEEESRRKEADNNNVFFVLNDEYPPPYTPKIDTTGSFVLGMPKTTVFDPDVQTLVDTGVMIIHPLRLSLMLSLRYPIQNSGLSLLGVSVNPASQSFVIKVLNTTTTPVQVSKGAPFASFFFYVDNEFHQEMAEQFSVPVKTKAISKLHTDSIDEELQEYSKRRGYRTASITLNL